MVSSVVLIHVRLGDGEVAFDHFEGQMALDPLARRDVASDGLSSSQALPG